ncbi:MAG: flagellar basal body P-ring formation protein FlgA [Devosia sp.]|uniref:flagellar basal body P-ring formation chaperone FlgA n=1 Tax=Devosia sp. TaxID=1871048 RepID=UPI001A5263C7|nr:flagellar basal body P-ring formation chaperone FlgA [Devosia sp.]MBL8600142.1 flagellar basal body P-ring formation protein FlgA [Devosia sp.]
MTLRLSLALLATLLSVPAALAVPTLKGDITVNKAIVTIGDMFDDAGNLAETGIFMAPAPGTTGVVPLADLTRAATLAGLTEFENVGYSRVRVARASTLVDAALLDDLIGADLERRGIVSGEVTAALRFNVADVSFDAEAVADPATLVSLRYTPGNNGFSARFMIAGIAEPVDLDGTIQLMTRAPRLTKTLPTGTILSQGDFEFADVPLATADAGGYADISQLVGKQLVRQARGGIMLKATDVTEPKVVTRNTLVTVVLRSGPMTLTVKGTALTTAAVGEPVDVLNSVTRKILHGVARSDGAVEIVTATTTNVAGL